jgi:hypothetical protein
MTLAPRVEVYTTLACEAIQPVRSTHAPPLGSSSTSSLKNSTLGPYGTFPYVAGTTSFPSIYDPTTSSILIRYPDIPETIDTTPQTLHESESSSELLTRFPRKHCFTDPKVQQHAAELQTLVTLTMGILTALTTGWWGSIGDKIGRTKVIALSQIGCLFTYVPFSFHLPPLAALTVPRHHTIFSDLVFLVISKNSRALVPFGGHRLILLGPIVEGLLGGWYDFISSGFNVVIKRLPHQVHVALCR